MTKVATIDKRRFVHIVIIAAMMLATLLAAMIPAVVSGADNEGDNEGEVEGQFSLNNDAPTVNSVTLYEHDDINPAMAMDPTVEYIVQVSVTDLNTLADLDSLYVTVYYDEDDTYDIGDVPVSGSARDGAILKWDDLNTWDIDDGGSTWTIEADSVDPDDLGAQNTFTFEFHFKPGEVAKESSHDVGDNAEWMIYAEATDFGGPSTHGAHQDGLEMNWYGKISVVVDGGGNVAFGNLDLGDPDVACTNTVTATYTSNGPFDENVKADATWSSVSLNEVTLDEDGGDPEDGEITLKADDDETLADAVIVLSSGYTPIDQSDTFTTESGHPVTMRLWITIAATGIENDTFTGTIFYQISNGS